MLNYDSVKYNNSNPFLDYIKKLSEDEQSDIFVAIDKLIEIKESNQRIPDKLSKYIANGIFELKVRHTNRISRCLYFFIRDKKIIFTNAFIKKQRKTPINEIEKAYKLRNYYLKENSR